MSIEPAVQPAAVEPTAVEPAAAARPQRGDELELRIESLAFGGEGVARLGDGGYVVFVAGAIPGDRVRAVVHKRKRSYAHARTLEVLEPSPERIAPVAKHPGVPWQVLPYERQLQIKQTQVDEALKRIGHLDGYELAGDRARRAAVALPQQARVLLRRGRRRRRRRAGRAAVRLSRARRRQSGDADGGLPAGLRARQPGARGRAALVSRGGLDRLGSRPSAGDRARRSARAGSAADASGAGGAITAARSASARRPTGARACATSSCAKAPQRPAADPHRHDRRRAGGGLAGGDAQRVARQEPLRRAVDALVEPRRDDRAAARPSWCGARPSCPSAWASSTCRSPPRRSFRRTPRWPSGCMRSSSSTRRWRAGSACTTSTAGSARSRSRSRRARASCGASS